MNFSLHFVDDVQISATLAVLQEFWGVELEV